MGAQIGTPIFANLLALAHNTVSTLDFSNVSVDIKRVVAESDNTVDEHRIIAQSTTTPTSGDQGNVLAIWNKEREAYSAVRFLRENEVERGAIGTGNPGSSEPYKNRFYFSAGSVDEPNVGLILVQENTYNGSEAFGKYTRLSFDGLTGLAALLTRTSSGSLQEWDTTSIRHYAPVTLHATYTSETNYSRALVSLSGNTLGFTAQEAGASIGTLTGYSFDKNVNLPSITGTTSLSLTAFDGNNGIYIRSGGDRNQHFSFGGVLGDGDGVKGHAFYTNGWKFQIANDGVKAFVPIVLKGYTVATLPTGIQGMYAFVTDALLPAFLATVAGGGAVVSPVFYNGSNWVTI